MRLLREDGVSGYQDVNSDSLSGPEDEVNALREL